MSPSTDLANFIPVTLETHNSQSALSFSALFGPCIVRTDIYPSAGMSNVIASSHPSILICLSGRIRQITGHDWMAFRVSVFGCSPVSEGVYCLVTDRLLIGGSLCASITVAGGDTQSRLQRMVTREKTVSPPQLDRPQHYFNSHKREDCLTSTWLTSTLLLQSQERGLSHLNLTDLNITSTVTRERTVSPQLDWPQHYFYSHKREDCLTSTWLTSTLLLQSQERGLSHLNLTDLNITSTVTRERTVSPQLDWPQHYFYSHKREDCLTSTWLTSTLLLQSQERGLSHLNLTDLNITSTVTKERTVSPQLDWPQHYFYSHKREDCLTSTWLTSTLLLQSQERGLSHLNLTDLNITSTVTRERTVSPQLDWPQHYFNSHKREDWLTSTWLTSTLLLQSQERGLSHLNLTDLNITSTVTRERTVSPQLDWPQHYFYSHKREDCLTSTWLTSTLLLQSQERGLSHLNLTDLNITLQSQERGLSHLNLTDLNITLQSQERGLSHLNLTDLNITLQSQERGLSHLNLTDLNITSTVTRERTVSPSHLDWPQHHFYRKNKPKPVQQN